MQLSKKHAVGILSTMIAAVGLVGILAWATTEPENKKNSFVRAFKPQALTELSVLNKAEDVVDFAGATESNIYFKMKSPEKLLVTNYDLKSIKNLEINLPKTGNEALGFTTLVDSPNICIAMGNLPAIITFERDSAILSKFPALFTKSVVISPNNIAVRIFDKSDQVFAKVHTKTGRIQKEDDVSERNGDAGISTDGMLHYDKTTNILTYVMYYRNQFLCMDTNLNLLYKGKTIDTTGSARIKVDASSGDMMTNNAPNRYVNGRSSVTQGYLYNNSKLKADNESSESFTKGSVVDIYKLKNGAYTGSFYIPFYKGEKMMKFKMVNDRVYVMYKSTIVCYQMSF